MVAICYRNLWHGFTKPNTFTAFFDDIFADVDREVDRVIQLDTDDDAYRRPEEIPAELDKIVLKQSILNM
jgi:hypothetical protein